MTIGPTGLGPVTGDVGNGAGTLDHRSPTDLGGYAGKIELLADAYYSHHNQTYAGSSMSRRPRHSLLGKNTSEEAVCGGMRRLEQAGPRG